jgi:hypothetical protein
VDLHRRRDHGAGDLIHLHWVLRNLCTVYLDTADPIVSDISLRPLRPLRR